MVKPDITHSLNSPQTLAFELSEIAKARANAAPRPMTDCQMYFSRERMPSGSFFTTLRQSSTQPMAPKPKVTNSTIQTKRLVQSNHSKVEMAMDNRIKTPPMVGVPLLAKWVCMP